MKEFPPRSPLPKRLPWPPLRRGFPLALTLLTTATLLLVPTLLLRRFPRAQAVGLEKLLANVSLLQSFRADAERPVPAVWQQRFGAAAAERLWRSQSRTWWQFWDGHSEGSPFLALTSRGLPDTLRRSLPVAPLTVGDLTVFPPDPLARQLLQDRLQPQVRRSPGLRVRCLPRLESDQAVFWRPAALGVLLGPLAPFLQGFQEGCLSFTVRDGGLVWLGEAASIEGMVLQVPASAAGEAPPGSPPSPNGDALLEVRGSSLEQLMAGLLARELIRQPLAERYGIGPAQLEVLRQTPFRLLLRPRSQGQFQASIELVVGVKGQRAQWREGLTGLAKRLEKEGLRLSVNGAPATPGANPSALGANPSAPGSTPSTPGSSSPTPSAAGSLPAQRPASTDQPAPVRPSATGSRSSRLPAASGSPASGTAERSWPRALWQRQDGVVVGGWQWRERPGQQEQITLFLGPPSNPPADLIETAPLLRRGMVLLARPQQLAQRGLLPPNLPEVVRRSAWLSMTAEPLAGVGQNAPLNRLQGALRLRP